MPFLPNLSDHLYSRLPEIYRIRDAEVGYPLKAFYDVLFSVYENSDGSPSLTGYLQTAYDFFDPAKCPAELLPLACADAGMWYHRSVPDKYIRKLLAAFPDLLMRKGTIPCIKFLCRTLSGQPSALSEYFLRTVTNLVTNGDFSNGTTGWLPSSLTIQVVSGAAKLLATSQYANISQAQVIPSGHVAYLQAKVKTTAGGGMIRLKLASEADYATHSGSGQYETLSVRSKATGDRVYIVADYRTSGWDDVYVDDFLAVDLTAVFGAGSEPTKEQFEAIFAYQTPKLLKNLLVNSNFASGTTGWSSYASTHSVSGGILTNVANGAAANGQESRQATVSASAGHKYYLRFKARVTNALCTLLYGCVSNGAEWPTLGRVTSPIQNQWYVLSGIASIAQSDPSLSMYAIHEYADATSANGQAMEIDGNSGVMLIDLTDGFGAGNEPTQAQMDAIVDSLGGWWEGEKQYGTDTTLAWWEGSTNIMWNPVDLTSIAREHAERSSVVATIFFDEMDAASDITQDAINTYIQHYVKASTAFQLQSQYLFSDNAVQGLFTEDPKDFVTDIIPTPDSMLAIACTETQNADIINAGVIVEEDEWLNEDLILEDISAANEEFTSAYETFTTNEVSSFDLVQDGTNPPYVIPYN